MVTSYIIGAVLTFTFCWTVFRRYNMGLSHKSLRQQFCRYCTATLLTFVAVGAAQRSLAEPAMLMAALVSVLWICSFNILYDKTYRKCSPDYDNRIDIAFGIYLYGWLVGLYSVLTWFLPLGGAVIIGTIETALMLIPLVHIGYFVIYKTCADFAIMETVIDTNANEVIEFIKSFSWSKRIAMFIPLLLSAALCFAANIRGGGSAAMPSLPHVLIAVGMTVFFSFYIWKRHHGLFFRTGLIELYLNVKEYKHTNEQYKKQADERLRRLCVKHNTPQPTRPHTILMVIGESACRDYMNAFSPQPWDNTPWESACRGNNRHFTFFGNAFSCAHQTVPTLEKALTESNQYNGKDFVTSCSIVDIAHKAGYRVHWYSNQGHIGAADTPVTLVAETSDVAKWTNQELGKVYYDASLVDFLDEIDPKRNNFLVLHLKGSHSNFSNRYPVEFAESHELKSGDDVQNFRISLQYTDHILECFFNYATEKLNMMAMVYFSDHGTAPARRRAPKMIDAQMVKIPLWTYLSDEYIALHPNVSKALKANQEKFFTNDLAYELMCGIFDITSDNYNETSSIASEKYKFTSDTLLTDNGRMKISSLN